MSNSIAPGSSADVNVKVTALTTNPNVPAQYKTIILKKNLVNGVNTLTQEMLSEANIKYVIKYDYTLAEDITIPANCMLEFDGGSLSGAYTLSGNNTGIDAGLNKIFNTDIIIDGTWVITEAHPEWFGAITNNDDIDNSVYIQAAIDFVENIGGGVVSLEGGNYYALKNTIYMKTRTSLKGKGHCVRENENVSTLKCIFANSNSWVIDNKIKGTIDGVNGEHVALYNDISYNELAGTTTSKVSSLIRQWSYSIENINIYSSTALYGGIRLFNPLYSTIRGCRIYGTIFGISIRSAWNFNIEDCGILACRYGMVFGYDCTHVYTKNVSVACPSYTRNLVSDYTLPIIDSNFYPPYIGTPDGNGGYSTPTDAQKKAYTCGVGYTNDAYGNHIHLAVEWCDIAIGGVRHNGVYVGIYIENVNMVLWNYARTSAPGDTITLLGGSCNVLRSTLESYYMYGIVNLGKVIVEDFVAGRCYTPASDVNLSDDAISNAKKRYVIDLKTSTHESALYYDEWGSGYTNCKKSPYKMFINYPKNIEIDKNNGVGSIGIGSGGTSTERINFVEAIKRLDVFVSYEPNFEQYPADTPIVNNKDIKLISSSNKDLQLLGPIRLKDTKIEFLSDNANIAPRKTSSYDTYGFGLSGKCYIRINNAGFTNYFNALSKWFNIDGDCDVIFSVPSPQSLGIDYKTKINNPKTNHKYTITVVDDSTGNVVGVVTNLYGATTERPELNTSNKGFQYFDETLGKPIYWTGSTWVDATGTVV